MEQQQKYARPFAIRLSDNDRRILASLSRMTTRTRADVVRWLLREKHDRLVVGQQEQPQVEVSDD